MLFKALKTILLSVLLLAPALAYAEPSGSTVVPVDPFDQSNSELTTDPSFAQIIDQTYNNPAINNIWVDRCVESFGQTQCGLPASARASLAFCLQQGGQNWVSNHTQCESGTHDTYRYTEKVVSGQVKTTWEFCPGCTCRLAQVVCRFNVK